MDVRKEFERFARKTERVFQGQGYSRIRENILGFLEEQGDCGDPSVLDEYLRSSKGDSESAARLIRAFYAECESAGNPVDSSLPEQRLIDSPLLRQLEIAKYLQLPHTKGEIAEHFGRTESSIQKDLRELREGITVMGAEIRIGERYRNRRKVYTTTVHPVFLPLNLAELYLMTIQLVEDTKGSVFHAEYRAVAERIWGQMSDYARSRLEPMNRDGLAAAGNRFREERPDSLRGRTLHALKSGETCRYIRFRDREGTERTLFRAGIGHAPGGKGYAVFSGEERVPVDLEGILEISPDLEE